MKPITYLQNLPPIPKRLIFIKSLLLFIMLSDGEQCQAQLSGVITVGSNVGNNYTSLTNVGGIFEDINTLGLSGDLSIEISSDLINETGTVPLNQWSGGYKVQIVPSTTGIKTIYHSSCSSDLISLLGTDSLLIDGRFSGIGNNRYLHFVSSCNNQSVIQLENDCENVTLRNCIISSDNSMTSVSSGGAIHISDNQTNGSDNLLIYNNVIQDYLAPIDLFDAVQVNAPNNTGASLTGLRIVENEIINANGKGFYFVDQNGSINAAAILGNSFYATGTISGPGAGWTYALIQLESGDGHIIRGNYFGGTGPNCSGNKMDVSLANGTELVGIIRMKDELPFGSTNFIDSNVIQNIHFNGGSSDVVKASLIRVESGNVSIGVNTGNIIGDNNVDASTVAGSSIVVSESYNNSSNYLRVINSSSSGTVNVENNSIGGILLPDNNSDGLSAYMLYSNGSSANFNNNTIGGVANNIVKLNQGNFRIVYSNNDDFPFSISNNTISGIRTATSFDEDFYGIRISGGNGTPTVVGNSLQIITLDNPSTQPRFYGILCENPNARIDSNQLYRVVITSSYSGVQFYGIHLNEGGSNHSVVDNTLQYVYLNAPSINASLVGIYSTSASTFNISKNFVSELFVNSGHSSSYIRGININSATQNNISNNVVLIDNGTLNNGVDVYGIYDNAGSGTNTIYHNTIDIRGTGTGSARSACMYKSNSASRDIQNNIFNNRRTGGSGGNYSIYFSSTSGTLTCNYNLLYAEENSGNLVRYSSNRDFTAWQGLGYASNSVNPVAPQNLVDFTWGRQTTLAGNDIGNPTLGILDDCVNINRPLDADFDMGAYEMFNDSLVIALPVNLLNFEVINKSHEVEVIWATLSEVNSDYFSILRSQDGLNFKSIGRVKAMGNSSTQVNYSLVDKNPIPGLSYYQLKQVDENGNSEYFQIIPIYRQSIEVINYYPNPTKNQLHIELNSDVEKTVSIKVENVIGQVVNYSTHDIIPELSTLSIDISYLDAGTYFIRIADLAGNQYTYKQFIKNK